MQIITDLFIGFISGYLAITGSVADTINDWITPTEETETIITQTTLEEEISISSIPSIISRAIPDVLLRSADYQKAAVIDSVGLTGATTNEPLEAIVNIYCTFTTKDYTKTTTGTGFFIDPDGVIMTNAHVAQFLLLQETDEDGKTECVIRNGNPATPKYHAELLYLPPAWIQENASVMNDKIPMGTGERDYSLLYVSSTLDKTPLPAVFPALDFDTSFLPLSTKGKEVIAAGYPATALLKNGADADLIPQQATSSVTELYTFGSNYADVFSISSSDVGAEGSSGGPVLNENGAVIGMIVTKGDDTIDGSGSLRAITLSHIERTILEETNFTLKQNLAGNLPYRAGVFAKTLAPFLLAILQQAD